VVFTGEDIRQVVAAWNGTSFNGGVPRCPFIDRTLAQYVQSRKDDCDVPFMVLGWALSHIAGNAFPLSNYRLGYSPELKDIVNSQYNLEQAIEITEFDLKTHQDNWREIRDITKAEDLAKYISVKLRERAPLVQPIRAAIQEIPKVTSADEFDEEDLPF